MKCETAQQCIVQYIYGELPDENCHSLEQHLSGCERCRNEMKVYEALRHAMSLAPVQDPSPNLLAQCRVRLDDVLDQLPPASLWLRAQTGFFGFFAQLRAAPGLAVSFAVLGLALGGVAGHFWSYGQPGGNDAAQKLLRTAALPVVTTAPTVYSVSGIVRHPDTNMVEVHFNQMVPATVEGSVDDPEVQKLLLMGTQNTGNEDVQNNSISLLADQCRAGHYCEGGPVRTALMVALRYDRDSSVRLKALQGLEPYVAQDVRVRDAVLESLMHDPNQAIRKQALTMLEPVHADSSVRVVLQTLATQDESPAMREASMKVLRSMPETN